MRALVRIEFFPIVWNLIILLASPCSSASIASEGASYNLLTILRFLRQYLTIIYRELRNNDQDVWIRVSSVYSFFNRQLNFLVTMCFLLCCHLCVLWSFVDCVCVQKCMNLINSPTKNVYNLTEIITKIGTSFLF